MFLDKGHDAIITFEQIGAHQVAIIIAIDIHLAQDQISAVGWADL